MIMRPGASIRNLIKGLIPRRIRPAVITAYRWFRYSKRPRIVSWRYDSEDVLQCCIAYNRYGGYCVPLELRFGTIAQALFRGKVAEEETIRFLVSGYSGGDIVHAGAFIGDFLPALSKACDEGGLVWAFEPARTHYRCSLITLQLNALTNVKLFNAALGDFTGEATMLTSDENGPLSGGSRIVATAGEFDVVETIRMVTIDGIIPADRKVSVVHLDVEGQEKQALVGGIQTIRRCRPLLILESVPNDEWMTRHITPLGYRAVGRIENNTILVPEGSRAG